MGNDGVALSHVAQTTAADRAQAGNDGRSAEGHAHEPAAHAVREQTSQGRGTVPLGVILLDKLINSTRGSLSIDLKRPQLPRDDRARSSLFTVRRPQAALQPGSTTYGSSGGGYYAAAHPPPPMPQPYSSPPGRRWQQQPAAAQAPPPGASFDPPSVAFGSSGARVKALRHVQFGPRFTQTKYGRTAPAPAFDLAAGLGFEFDTATLRPVARLKYLDTVSLRALPEPSLRVQKRLQLGTSGYGVRLSYECPLDLDALSRFYMPPARLMVQLDNAVETGMRVTQSGLEFAANLWLLDGAAHVRGVGMLRLPSELPVDEGQELMGFDVKRLGIKARW